jgi:hypothetical protein
MAFLLYFFVLLVAASSILFALDWVNAPLHAPASTERPQVAASATQTRAKRPEAATRRVRIGQQRPASTNGSTAADETRAVQSAPEAKPETVGKRATAERQQAQPANSVPQQQAETMPSATPTNPEFPTQPKPVAEQQKPAKPEPVAEQQQPTASHPTTEHPMVGAAPEQARAQANRTHPRRRSAQTARSARAQVRARTPPGEAEYQREEGVPVWAIRGAEAATREADDARMRRSFRPFWEPQEGWHFR